VSVRPAEHSRFLDPRELRDALLDFLREELEPRHEDDSFLAALEVHGARLIARADVTGQEPAVPGDLFAKPPGHIVRREEAVPPHRDLPKRPRVLAHPLVGEHGDLVAGHGKAHGGGREVPGSHVDAGQTGFDDAVGLADRHAVARFEAIDHGRRDRRAGREAEPHARQRLAPSEVAHALEVERGGIEHAGLEPADRVDECPGEGVGAQENVSPGPHIGDDRHREVIRERQHPEDAVLLAEAQDGVGGLDPGRRGLVRQHDTFAARGCPGGEPDEGGVQPSELRRAFGATVDPPEREPVAHAARHDRRALRAEERIRLGPGQAAVQLDLGHDLGGLHRREVTGERGQAGAGGQQPEGGGQVREVVRGHEPDPLTGPHALGDQECGDSLRFTSQLPVAHRTARPHVRHRGAAGVPRGR